MRGRSSIRSDSDVEYRLDEVLLFLLYRRMFGQIQLPSAQRKALNSIPVHAPELNGKAFSQIIKILVRLPLKSDTDSPMYHVRLSSATLELFKYILPSQKERSHRDNLSFYIAEMSLLDQRFSNNRATSIENGDSKYTPSETENTQYMGHAPQEKQR